MKPTTGLSLMSSLLSLLLSACSNPPYPRGDLDRLYPQPPRPELADIPVQGRSLHVARMSGNGQTPLIFIHGSPGDWKAWAHYLNAPELADYSPRIAVDRPGYGGSGPGDVMPDLRAQAALLAELIPPGPPAVIVGHSLGGPLVGWLALDHPEKVCGGVMVAGSIAGDLEAPRWYNLLATTWLGRWLAPKQMLWSNVEILALQGELKKLEQAWPRLQRPLVLIQGDRDELVDPRTADFAEQHLPAQWLRIVRVPHQGHFVLWKQPQTVIAAIKSLHCETPSSTTAQARPQKAAP